MPTTPVLPTPTPPGQQIQQFSININFDQLLAANRPAGTKALLERLGLTRDSTVLSIVLAEGAILAGDLVAQLESLVLKTGKKPRLDLFLRSTGGIAEIPWRILTVLREFSEHLGAIVPRVAMSGATHVAIGCDELLMGPFSNLGSVDPTRSHPLLPKDSQGNTIPTSVQHLKHCLEFLKRTVPTGEPLGPMITELFRHVEPLALGALEESYELSRLISTKVLATRRPPIDKEKADAIRDQLAGAYFSHTYYISRGEVETELQLPVTRFDPGQAVFEQIEALNAAYDAILQMNIQLPAPVPVQLRVTGLVETAQHRFVLAQVFAPNGQIVAGHWLEQDNY